MCMPFLFTRVVAECVCYIDLPEWGLNVYALLTYQSGIECVCLVDLPEWALNVYVLLIYQSGD